MLQIENSKDSTKKKGTNNWPIKGYKNQSIKVCCGEIKKIIAFIMTSNKIQTCKFNQRGKKHLWGMRGMLSC